MNNHESTVKNQVKKTDTLTATTVSCLLTTNYRPTSYRFPAPDPDWLSQRGRHVDRPAASSLQTNDAFFDTIKDGFVPLLHTLLTDEQTRGKMYRATNRGWLALLPGKLQELEDTTVDKPNLQEMHNQVVACGAILRCFPPPSNDAAGDGAQHVCRYCWEMKSPMWRCNGACGRRARYCSSEHQKLDWKCGHKKECKKGENESNPPMNEDGSVSVNLTLGHMRNLMRNMGAMPPNR